MARRPRTDPSGASRVKMTCTGRRLRPPTHELKQWNSSRVVTHSAPAAQHTKHADDAECAAQHIEAMEQLSSKSSGGFRGGRAGSAPSPLGDGLTPSLTVMLANAKCWSFCCTHGTQNVQNSATSRFLTALECKKFVFGRGSATDRTGGAYSAPPDALAGLRGSNSKWEGKGRGKEGETPPFANSWIRPWSLYIDWKPLI